MHVSSYEDLASEFCCVGSIFSMKLLEFVSKAIKLLLTLAGLGGGGVGATPLEFFLDNFSES